MRRTESAARCGDSWQRWCRWKGAPEEVRSRAGVVNAVTNGAAPSSCALTVLATVSRGSATSGRHACDASPLIAVAGADSVWHEATSGVASSSRHSSPHASSRPDARSIMITSRCEVERSDTVVMTMLNSCGNRSAAQCCRSVICNHYPNQSVNRMEGVVAAHPRYSTMLLAITLQGATAPGVRLSLVRDRSGLSASRRAQGRETRTVPEYRWCPNRRSDRAWGRRR